MNIKHSFYLRVGVFQKHKHLTSFRILVSFKTAGIHSLS